MVFLNNLALGNILVAELAVEGMHEQLVEDWVMVLPTDVPLV